MNIIITMAGKGTRFRNAGYNIPKFMIEAKGKTLFDWAMISLDGYKEITKQYIFIVMKDDKEDVEKFIEQHCKILNLVNYKIIVIDYLTDGQAATAMLAKELCENCEPVLIYNIDTYVEKGCMSSEELKGDGFIPCFRADGSHWSFVKLDNNGKVVEIKEKVRISDYCTIGAYYFKSFKLFSSLYYELYCNEENLVNGEKYIAPMYNLLLQKGGKIFISDVNVDRVHILGTPEELQEFLKQ